MLLLLPPSEEPYTPYCVPYSVSLPKEAGFWDLAECDLATTHPHPSRYPSSSPPPHPAATHWSLVTHSTTILVSATAAAAATAAATPTAPASAGSSLRRSPSQASRYSAYITSRSRPLPAPIPSSYVLRPLYYPRTLTSFVSLNSSDLIYCVSRRLIPSPRKHPVPATAPPNQKPPSSTVISNKVHKDAPVRETGALQPDNNHQKNQIWYVSAQNPPRRGCRDELTPFSGIHIL